MRFSNAFVPIVALFLSSAAFAQSPADGTWTLNTAKSRLAGDTMNFEDAGTGQLKYSDSDESYTLKTDGSSIVTPLGTERTFKKTGDDSYEATSKRNGNLLSTSAWKVSADGNSLVIDSKGTKPNGDKFNDSVTYTRTAPGTGLVGGWKSTKVKLSSPSAISFQSSGQDDVTLSISAIKATCNAKWDGKDYPASGPTVPDGVTLALTKTGPNTFKMVEKIKTKAVAIVRYTVAADGKSMVAKGTNGAGKEPYTEIWEKQS